MPIIASTERSRKDLSKQNKALLSLIVFIVALISPSTFPSDEYIEIGDDVDYLDFPSRFLREKGTARAQPVKILNSKKTSLVADGYNEMKELLIKQSTEAAEFASIRSMLKQLPKDDLLDRFHRIPKHNVTERSYCEHSTNLTQAESSCYKLLSPQVQSKRAWFFFGDSQMGRLFQNIKYPYKISTMKRTKDRRCGFLDYCHLDKAKRWIPPSSIMYQGPINYGLKNVSEINCTFYS